MTEVTLKVNERALVLGELRTPPRQGERRCLRLRRREHLACPRGFDEIAKHQWPRDPTRRRADCKEEREGSPSIRETKQSTATFGPTPAGPEVVTNQVFQEADH